MDQGRLADMAGVDPDPNPNPEPTFKIKTGSDPTLEKHPDLQLCPCSDVLRGLNLPPSPPPFLG